MSSCPGEMSAVVNPRKKAFTATILSFIQKIFIELFSCTGAILGIQHAEMKRTNKNPYLHGAPIRKRRKDRDNKC